jgi:hypothetical protein
LKTAIFVVLSNTNQIVMMKLTYIQEIKSILAQARQKAYAAVNSAMVEGILEDWGADCQSRAAGKRKGGLWRGNLKRAVYCPDRRVRQRVLICQFAELQTVLPYLSQPRDLLHTV